MDVILHSILPFLGLIVVLIVVHELGHFFTAKLAGVKVLEFGIGYPPRVFGIKRGETEYTINALPLGGFVRLLGEEDPGDPRSLAAKPRWIRIGVLASGSAMNVLLAVALFAVALGIPREVDVSRARVGEVVPEGPAAEAGLEPGDVIFALNGTDVQSVGELGYQIRLNLGEEVTFRVKPAGGDPERVEAAGADGFLDVPVRARWSADPFVYHSAIAADDAIAADEELPIELDVTSTEGFSGVGTLVVGAGTANEEQFNYCRNSSSTLLLYERSLGGTTASSHAAGATLQRSVPQGPTGITIGPAYFSSRRALTAEEQARVAEDWPPCSAPPTYVDVPFSESQSAGPIGALVDGSKRSWESLVLARNEIVSRIRGGVGGGSGFQLTGPVGIAQLTGEVVEEAGWKSLLELAGLISMNLAVLNILPLPMLDGGRVTFVLIEVLRGGKRIAPEREAMVHFVGMVVLLTFAAVITFFDISRIWQGEGIIR